MQTLKHGAYSATLSPTRDAGAFRAMLSKITGKYKPTKISEGKRVYPKFYAGMSTAEYVQDYETANGSSKIGLVFRPGFYDRDTLNTEPCTLYTGEDTHEIIEDELIPVPEVTFIDTPPSWWKFSAQSLTFEMVTR